ncbi:uncharacterized protein G2W53_003798 [Senna tora]|uniref:Uncharacterized protein n=1 Tax=Senna tora TaxID=362788 RepID=A0A835CIR5_9FABA|nr:uncharacterized protein G2W53_003798 [Senna tora]
MELSSLAVGSFSSFSFQTSISSSYLAFPNSDFFSQFFYLAGLSGDSFHASHSTIKSTRILKYNAMQSESHLSIKSTLIPKYNVKRSV